MTTRRFYFIAALSLLMLVLAACNTLKGVGRDVEKAGETIQKTVEKHN